VMDVTPMLMIVLLVLVKESKLQSVDVQMVNSMMELVNVNSVPTNVLPVLELTKIVIPVPKTELITLTVPVNQDSSTLMDNQNVNNVLTDVILVPLAELVVLVTLQESILLLVTVLMV